MKTVRTIAVATLVIGLLILLVSGLDYLALTDIHRDYVSLKVFRDLGMPLPAGLPEWTGTRGEWQLVTISSVSTPAFLLLNSITLWLCVRALGNEGRSGDQDRRDLPV